MPPEWLRLVWMVEASWAAESAMRERLRERQESTARPKEVLIIACDMGAMFGMSWWMWFPGFLVTLTLLGFGIWAVGRLAHRPSGGALQVLEERLARGEIDAEEFRQRRTILGQAR